MKILILSIFILIGIVFSSEIDSLNLTTDELAYIKTIQKRGSFKIATRISPSVYEPQEDGSVVGVWYNLIEQFAKLIETPIDVTVVNSMNDFFLQDDTIPDGLKEGTVPPYTPDYLKKVDIYIYTIGVKSWRERIFRYIPIFPNRTVLVIRKGEEFKSYKELDRKIVSVESNSAPVAYFSALEKTHSISFKYINLKGSERFRAVATGEADISAVGSNRAITEIRKYDNLIISHSISDINLVGWVVKKDNYLLASILSKYINYTHKNGSFNSIWENYYGMSYLTYLELIGY